VKPQITRNQVFNLGSTEQNHRIREIAESVAEAFPGCVVRFGEPGPDNRSYRVSFEKVHRTLPHFSCDGDVQRGARQLHSVFRQIDEHFFWTET